MKGFIYVLLLSLLIPINGYPGTKKTDANAFRQSEKLLKLAATELVETITASDYLMFKEFPDRKKMLLNILPYENLVKFPGKDEIYKNGVLLSMDHQINPNLIMIYKPFFVIYAGTSDSEFEKKAVEVKKDLLMEASLIWGFDEKEAEAFADDFLQLKAALPKKLRPENSVFVKPDYCSCLNGKPDINNQCESYCRGTDQGPTLYGSVFLGEKILMDDALGSLFNWCNVEIPGVLGVSPKCVLEVYDGKSIDRLDMSLSPNNPNNFMVNINTLKQNVTYVAKIVETGSGTNNASSDAFQIRRILPPVTNHFPGPLKITPINQYSCLTTLGESDPNTRSNYFNLKATNHYYFEPRQKPPVGPPNAFVYCYDRDQFGPVDRITFPRLELIPKALSLWDKNDIRFSDTNGDGDKDINTLIDTEMLVKYGIVAKTDYFVPFKWPTAPSISAKGTPETGGEEAISTLGYMMRVFVDPYTGVGKCPTQEDYFGPDVTFQALRGVVGVDTEAIYIGVREKQTLNNPDGTTTEMPQDIILIRENELKRIWFYIENNLRIKPDDVTSSQQTIYFYYPPAPYMDPYVQKSYQQLYTVRDRGSLGATAQTSESTDAATPGLPSYDKRFGCIPSNGRNSPSEPTNSVDAQIEAHLRFSTMKARYFCQAEGKQQNPNFDLACNNKFLCTKLWKNSEPSFNGNCSDLDRREGLERYKENQISIVKDCGCGAENYPQSVDDKRCPDFKFKAIRDANGYILEIVCSVNDNGGANNLPNAENK